MSSAAFFLPPVDWASGQLEAHGTNLFQLATARLMKCFVSKLHNYVGNNYWGAGP